MRSRRSRLTTRRSRMCTANREPRSYHRTGHGIVPLTCCLELYSQGLSKPLSIPERKAMEDYIKEALYTCILVAVDRFSKACKLIPLRGLPTALKTSEALFHNLLRTFGILKDVVSDRGPQFVSVSGRLSSSSSMSLSASSLGITPRLMARLSGRFRRLGDITGPTVMTTSTAGTAYSRGPSMHKIPSASHHRPHPIPVHTRLPTPSISLDRRAL